MTVYLKGVETTKSYFVLYPSQGMKYTDQCLFKTSALNHYVMNVNRGKTGEGRFILFIFKINDFPPHFFHFFVLVLVVIFKFRWSRKGNPLVDRVLLIIIGVVIIKQGGKINTTYTQKVTFLYVILLQLWVPCKK